MADPAAQAAAIVALIAANPDPADITAAQLAVWEAVATIIGGAARHAEIGLSTDHTSPLTVNTPIDFDVAAGSLVDDGAVSLSSGAITLEDGGTYKIETYVSSTGTAGTGARRFRWRTSAGAAFTTISGIEPDEVYVNNDGSVSLSPATGFIVEVSGADLEIELRILNNTALTAIQAGSRVVITEVG